MDKLTLEEIKELKCKEMEEMFSELIKHHIV
jgi:hypothetical protein